MDPVPPISGIQDPSKAQVMLHQAGQPVRAPLDQIGLLTTSLAASTYLTSATAAATYLPLTGGTLSGDLTGTAVTVGGSMTAGNFISTTVNCVLASSAAGTVYLRPNGPASATGQAHLNSTGELTSSGAFVAVDGIKSYHGYACKAGVAGGFSNTFNWFWNNTAMEMWVDTVNCGTVNVTSDYRIKKDVVDLPSTWDQVKALRPISYTQTGFTPPMSDEMAQKVSEQEEALGKPPAQEKGAEKPPLFANDDNEQWGFIAHELQENLLPTAASGHKDMEDGVQGLNLAPILAATVKALQEAMARIEALEGVKS